MTFMSINLLKAVKWSFFPKRGAERLENLTREEKRIYVVANYLFVVWTVSFLALQMYLVALGDNELRDQIVLKMSNEKTLIKLVVAIVVGGGRLGFMRLKVADWKNLSEEKVMAEKIYLGSQIMGFVITLYWLCGFYS